MKSLQEYLNESEKPSHEKASKIDKTIRSSKNAKAIEEWDEFAEIVFDDTKESWRSLDSHEIESAIYRGEAIMAKYKIGKLNESSKGKQSIPNGSTATFMLRDSSPEDFADATDIKNIKEYDKKKCTVTFNTVNGDLGDKNYEYYDIKFEDGKEIEACSGYNLTLIKK